MPVPAVSPDRPTGRALASGSTGRTARSARPGRRRAALPREVIITDKAGSWAHAEDFVPADDVVLRAVDRAAQLGCPPVSTGTGAVLRLVAGALRASTVAEIGTGAGVSGLWLLRGMAPSGVLTTIDTEAEHQRAAKEAFADDGVRPARVRTITGRALDVLPRLTDAAYDMVVLDGDPEELAETVDHALRLLRPGGVLAVPHALAGDRVPDPAQRDATTTTLREVARALRDDERLLPAMLPTGDGLLLATRRA